MTNDYPRCATCRWWFDWAKKGACVLIGDDPRSSRKQEYTTVAEISGDSTSVSGCDWHYFETARDFGCVLHEENDDA